MTDRGLDEILRKANELVKPVNQLQKKRDTATNIGSNSSFDRKLSCINKQVQTEHTFAFYIYNCSTCELGFGHLADFNSHMGSHKTKKKGESHYKLQITKEEGSIATGRDIFQNIGPTEIFRKENPRNSKPKPKLSLGLPKKRERVSYPIEPKVIIKNRPASPEYQLADITKPAQLLESIIDVDELYPSVCSVVQKRSMLG